MPRTRLCFLLLIFSASLPTAAEEPEQPDLPTSLGVTEVVTMTDADEAYVSASLQQFKWPDQRQWTVLADAAYGITDRWRLYAELPYAFVEPQEGSSVHGIGDVESSVRYAAIDYRHKPFGLDVGLGLIWPSGDHSQGLGDGRTRIEPSLIASQWLGPVNAELHVAWAHAIDGSADQSRDDLEYNLAVIVPYRQVWLVLEGNGESSGGETSYHLTPEIVWKASEHVQWRLAAPIGVTSAAADYGVIAGCTIEFEHVFHHGD